MPENFRATVTLADAMRLGGPLSFNLMVKPAGSACNMNCAYCYYLGKAAMYGGREPRMDMEMLRRVVREYIEACDVDEVQFDWHGGEPLLLGLDFYRRAVEFEGMYACGKTVHNTIQTNGTLLDGEWAEFFGENGFLVGVSVDGPQDIHDSYRTLRGGGSSFRRVMEGISLLEGAGVQFNTLTAVSRASEGRGAEVYRFLKSIGSHYMQFLPVVEHVVLPEGPGGRNHPRIVAPGEPRSVRADWSVGDEAFGEFLCGVFDCWVVGDVGEYFVGQFDAALANWCGVPPGICAYSPTCGGNCVLEHGGDLYPCDHFVYPAYRLGNIARAGLREMMLSPARASFGIAKRNTLPRACRECRWLFACNGECPKHRFDTTEDGEAGLSSLCRGYRMFYSHAAPYMDYMRDLLLRDLPPSDVMPWARSRM